jgi:hypothetical protein
MWVSEPVYEDEYRECVCQVGYGLKDGCVAGLTLLIGLCAARESRNCPCLSGYAG